MAGCSIGARSVMERDEAMAALFEARIRGAYLERHSIWRVDAAGQRIDVWEVCCDGPDEYSVQTLGRGATVGEAVRDALEHFLVRGRRGT